MVDLVHEPPATAVAAIVIALQDQLNVLAKSVKRRFRGPSGTNLIPQPVCEKGVDAGSGPAVDVDEKCDLDPVPLVDEDEVVICPQCQKDPGQIPDGEIVFRPVLVGDDSF